MAGQRLPGSSNAWLTLSLRGECPSKVIATAMLEASGFLDPDLGIGWRVAERLGADDIQGTVSPHLVRFAIAGNPHEDEDLERRVGEINGPAAYARLFVLGAFDR